MEIEKILRSHELWARSSGKKGSRADLSGRDLRGRVFEGCCLQRADLNFANLSCCDFSKADLSYANLSKAMMTCTNLHLANLIGANLNEASLTWANLSWAYLPKASLRRTDLTGADLRRSNLRDTNLPNAIGLTDPINYIEATFERTEDGIIVYKVFGLYYARPESWVLKENSVIEELVNYDRRNDCSPGINVATKEWLKQVVFKKKENIEIWKCLIKWEWLPGVVVPYATDGKIRCSRLKLLEIVEI